ncbi:hypothetical protein ANCDUO_14887 [Ancylostoma duodenale]|uniref:Uncharacterized protein n=1 Tax=Ancylostoma duodenale TaxID=51022 RepID=A0A0C2G7V2_9BILA|nr:hypothetical protein ANCDUO_14887 [Ancylostoma duodenale]
MLLSTISTRVRSACSTSPRQRKESREFNNNQEAPVLGDPRADTPAWNSESLPTNVRARKTVQRSDKRRPQGQTSSSVGRSRKGREKHPQHPPRLHQPLGQDVHPPAPR